MPRQRATWMHQHEGTTAMLMALSCFLHAQRRKTRVRTQGNPRNEAFDTTILGWLHGPADRSREPLGVWRKLWAACCLAARRHFLGDRQGRQPASLSNDAARAWS